MKRTLKLGMVAVTAMSVATPLLVSQSAYADYAPTSHDVIGVGSDTLQYMLDFTADGDAYGTVGYNSIGNKNKLDNIDATADFNARLAFDANGSNGNGNGATTTCGPGSGTTAGTGNTGGSVSTTGPCVLNPTVVLRTGLQGAQRPNGSGAGFKALAGDVTDGTYTINFSRASGAQHPVAVYGSCGTAATSSSPAVPCFDSIVVGHENVVMIAANGTTGHTTNAVPLTSTELTNIYSASPGVANAYGTTGCVTWNQVGGSATTPIIPLIPQPGSGTRSFFEGQLGLTDSTLGKCTVISEENDPTAIASQASPPDAIEPMSAGRLDMFLGLKGNGTNGGIGGYFVDSTCGFDANSTACGTGSGSTYFTNPLAPPVKPIASSSTVTEATFPRDLYMYFRDSDINSTTPFQPGSSTNWLRTLFYNPCQSGQTCVSQTDPEGATVSYGPGGAPYIDTTAGYNAILDAGVTPVDPVATGFVRGGI